MNAMTIADINSMVFSADCGKYIYILAHSTPNRAYFANPFIFGSYRLHKLHFCFVYQSTICLWHGEVLMHLNRAIFVQGNKP